MIKLSPVQKTISDAMTMYPHATTIEDVHQYTRLTMPVIKCQLKAMEKKGWRKPIDSPIKAKLTESGTYEIIVKEVPQPTNPLNYIRWACYEYAVEQAIRNIAYKATFDLTGKRQCIVVKGIQ